MIHVYFGHSKHEPDDDETCMYCGHEPERGEHFAYTYSDAPVCGKCWDEHWRQTEDGASDPPFADFDNESSGAWL